MEQKCQVCGVDCGEYTLCPLCFEELQNGNLKKCNNCGKWYRIGEVCQCFRATPQSQTQPQTQSQTASQGTSVKPVKKERTTTGGIVFAILIIIFTVIGIVMSLPSKSSNKSNNDANITPGNPSNKTSIVTQMTKERPELIKGDEPDSFFEMTTLSLNLKANDNYKEVVVELYIYDENDTIIVQHTFTKTNLTKGNIYELSYTLSLAQAMDADHYGARIVSYK